MERLLKTFPFFQFWAFYQKLSLSRIKQFHDLALVNLGMNPYYKNFYCPLNPNFDRFYSELAELLSPSPILGDFQMIVPPKVGGLGGRKHN
jgi:hypothetical protein